MNVSESYNYTSTLRNFRRQLYEFNTEQSVKSCPRLAYHDAGIILQFQTTKIPDITSIACSINVSSSRIRYIEKNQKYFINITVESLLRAYDIRLFLTDMYKINQFYGFYPRDNFIACPSKVYFTNKGVYEYLPPHSYTPEDCYGFVCKNTFVRSKDNFCMVAPSDIFNTIVFTVLLLVAVWGLVIIFVSVFTNSFPVAKEDKVEQVLQYDMSDVLPISVTDTGDLMYELEDISSSSSSISVFDENPEMPASPRSQQM